MLLPGNGNGTFDPKVSFSAGIDPLYPVLADFDQMVEWAQSGLELAKSYTLENLDDLVDFGSFESNFVSLVRDDGALELYDGGLRAIDADLALCQWIRARRAACRALLLGGADMKGAQIIKEGHDGNRSVTCGR